MDIEESNPFVQCGQVLGRGRIIGREYALREIENRVIKHQGSLAIIGLPGIGVSSLVHTGLFERKEQLLVQDILPIEISIPHHQYDSHESFFRHLVRQCKYELKRLNWLTEPVENAARVALEEEYSFYDVQTFFEEVHQDGIRVIFVFHAFDYAGVIFNENVSLFQGLKTLAERAQCNVTLITLSCLPLDQIALQPMAISRFDQVFHPYYLGGFNEKDMEEFMLRLITSLTLPDTRFDNTLKAKLEERLDYYCGRHPYLLEKLGYELVEAFHSNNESVDVDEIFQVYEVKEAFHVYIHKLVTIFRKFPMARIFSKLQQVVIGPVVDISEDDIEKLKAYGLIKANKDTTPNEYGIVAAYVAFCHYLQSYLAITDLEDDLWSLWSQTEKGMRQGIAAILEREFGKGWFSILESQYPQISYKRDHTTLFSRCRTAHAKTIRERSNKPAINLLDYTYPKELFDLILYKPRSSSPPYKSLWDDIFHPIFSKDHSKNSTYWTICASFLGRVRNPLAHNRDYALYKEDREKANEYCREILHILHSYLPH